ncbi:Krueppel-like factor 17 [Orycteropus afer afer]|uniref:Krueppel-like factor 17 n=1 Tax=Orycteropus afer afer TaxID=1230840 RepID=A0A8B7ATJ4_ORYAF|nr:Krueppel-like factor 17 [Orycteropus afer afer]
MDQEAEGLSQWQKAMQHQRLMVTEQSPSLLDMSPSPGSSSMHNSWNHGPPGTQHFPQSTELARTPLVSAEAPRQNVAEVRPHFNMSFPEHDMSYFPQATLMLSQMICRQGESPSQPEMKIFNRSQMMPSGEPSIPGMPLTFGGNLSMPSSRPPDSTSNAIPMSHIRVPTMPYSGTPMVPSNTASSTNRMLLAPTMSSTEAQTMLPSLTEMLPPRDPHNFGMHPSVSSSLLDLDSQNSLMSLPDSQEGSFIPEQHIPAPQTTEKNSRAQEGALRRRSPVSRPYLCNYDNCGKAYTKRSHLVSHQRKHTGERPYGCKWEGCQWTFSRSDELGRHMRIHTRYRPHRCGQCGRQFMRSDHLRQHQRTHMRMPGSPDPQANNEQRADAPVPGL